MRIKTISKGDLCHALGLSSKSGRCYYQRLRTDYFNQESLDELMITPERYDEIKGKKTFNFFESKRIMTLFELEWEDFGL